MASPFNEHEANALRNRQLPSRPQTKHVNGEQLEQKDPNLPDVAAAATTTGHAMDNNARGLLKRVSSSSLSRYV